MNNQSIHSQAADESNQECGSERDGNRAHPVPAVADSEAPQRGDALVRGRARFQSHLIQHVAYMQPPLATLAMLSISIDGFDSINDAMGHQTGQLLLDEVALRLQGCLGQKHLLALSETNHYLLAVRDFASEEAVSTLAQSLAVSCAAPVKLKDRIVYVSLSIGIAMSSLENGSPEQLTRHADAAMHEASRSGGNHRRFFVSEMNTRVLNNARLAIDLCNALENDQFEIQYQPKISLTDGSITGFEALLRWWHPQHGLIACNDFIPVLEQTGLIVAVGEWVIQGVCCHMAQWRARGLPLKPVAINLSARQLESSRLAEVIVASLEMYNLEPSLLELEVTESSLIRDVDISAALLRRFSAMGMRIAVDDFGIGYSSLAYLKHLPVSTLKIDQTFVQGIGVDHSDTEITRTLIDLAHRLHMKVVAEGVENRQQLDYLKEHDCDEVQGFHVGYPGSAGESAALLDRDKLQQSASAPATCASATWAPAASKSNDLPSVHVATAGHAPAFPGPSPLDSVHDFFLTQLLLSR